MKLILILLVTQLITRIETNKRWLKNPSKVSPSTSQSVYFFNKCTYTRPNPLDCSFTLATKQYIWDSGSCQQRMAGTEQQAFAYLSLAVGKQVCCDDGKQYTVNKVEGKVLSFAECKDISHMCNASCDAARFRARRRSRRFGRKLRRNNRNYH